MNTMRKAVCILGTGAALAAAPAFAHDGQWQRADGYRGGDHRAVRIDHGRYYHPARPYARPPVAYYAQPVYPAQPAYYGQPAYGVTVVPPGAVIGAAAGAMIGSQMGDRHNRAATTAIGAFLGGLLGSQM